MADYSEIPFKVLIVCPPFVLMKLSTYFRLNASWNLDHDLIKRSNKRNILELNRNITKQKKKIYIKWQLAPRNAAYIYHKHVFFFLDHSEGFQWDIAHYNVRVSSCGSIPETWTRILTKFTAPGGTAQRYKSSRSDSDSPAPGSRCRPVHLNCYWWENVSSSLPPPPTLCIDELRCHARQVQPR